MLYPLRPHQQKALDMARHSFSIGLKRPLIYLPTGAGKTVIAGYIIAGALDRGKSVTFVAPYLTLINQTAESMMKQGLPQPGIIQAQHPWYDPENPFQIASVQTLSRRTVKPADIYIVDECDLQYKFTKELIENTDIPVIGLTATPYAKGLGKYYNNLLKPAGIQELMDNNYLCEYKAWAASHPDMNGCPVKNGDFVPKFAEERMGPAIVAEVTDTWLKLGQNKATICFAVSVSHANFIGSEFDKLGVPNRVVTGSTPTEEREEIYQEYREGTIKILVSCMVLIAGFDEPVGCIILARPMKSERVFQQSVGRGLRIQDGKEYLILLDHGGNIERLGYIEDIGVDKLCTGEKKKSISARETKEKEEKLPKSCPKCAFVKDAGVNECPECGFTPRVTEDVEVISGTLIQIKGKTIEVDAQQILDELRGYQIESQFKGKVRSDGWVKQMYKKIMGEWPNGMDWTTSGAEPSAMVRGKIKQSFIAYARSRKK